MNVLVEFKWSKARFCSALWRRKWNFGFH